MASHPFPQTNVRGKADCQEYPKGKDVLHSAKRGGGPVSSTKFPEKTVSSTSPGQSGIFRRAMCDFHFDSAVVLQEAAALRLPEEAVGMLTQFCNFLRSGGYGRLAGDALEDFFTLGEWLHSETVPAPLADFPQKELLFLALTLNAVPLARKRFQEKGLPAERLDEGLADLRLWCLDHMTNYGTPGMEWGWGLHWLFLRIFTGQVLRFGRLECNRAFFYPDVIVLKQRRTGCLRLLNNRETAVNEAGCPAAPGEKAVRVLTPAVKGFSELIAFPIRPDGSCAAQTEIFRPEEWEAVLRPGDNVLSLHIPADGPLDPDRCRESMRRMREFHQENGFPLKGFICSSWFLNADLERFAGADSNLVKFQKLGHLIGPTAPETDAVRRVFGVAGIRKESIRTTLQRKLAAHFAAGGTFPPGRIIIDPATL